MLVYLQDVPGSSWVPRGWVRVCVCERECVCVCVCLTLPLRVSASQCFLSCPISGSLTMRMSALSSGNFTDLTDFGSVLVILFVGD